MNNNKKSFVLLATLIFVSLLMIYSLIIVENKNLSSNLNKLKYLHLQAKIHMKIVKQKIKNNQQPENIILDDDRFLLNIIKTDNIYTISIKSKSEPIRLYSIYKI